MDTQQHHDSSLMANPDSYTTASEVQGDSFYDAAQPLSPAAHAEQTARPPSFSAFTFSRTAGHVDLRQTNAADGAPTEPHAHGQMSPKGTSLDGVFPNGSHNGQGNQHQQHARPDSMESTGSSWRGMGAGSDSDYDLLKSLPGSLPASPTKATVVSRLDRIHEEQQKEDDRSGDEGDSDDANTRQDAAVQAFLRDNESGWNLADLRAIQQKLVDSAISRDVPAVDVDRQAHSLGSPFVNGEASFPPSSKCFLCLHHNEALKRSSRSDENTQHLQPLNLCGCQPLWIHRMAQRPLFCSPQHRSTLPLTLCAAELHPAIPAASCTPGRHRLLHRHLSDPLTHGRRRRHLCGVYTRLPPNRGLPRTSNFLTCSNCSRKD